MTTSACVETPVTRAPKCFAICTAEEPVAPDAPFTDAQRLWVIGSIYLTVIGWAYAIGALLTLLQDRAFRQALAVQHFERKVRRISEPFLIVAGYGQTGALLVQSFDALGRQLVVLDTSPEKIDALDLMPYRGDVPGLFG